MKIRESVLGVLLVAAVSLSACGVASSGQGDSAQGPAPAAKPTEEKPLPAEEMADDAMSADQEMTGAEMSADENMTDDEAMAAPAWYAAQLTDVNTGSTFRVADFKGRVVLVETMAVWCSTCLRQQQQVQALHELLGERDDLVSLALGIDPNETPDVLKAHADRHGFDWRYAIAPVEVAREIGQLYGDQFLNPPSAPMLIIDRQGQAHPLPFGVKSAQALQEALGPNLN